MVRGPWLATVHAVTELDTTEHACSQIESQAQLQYSLQVIDTFGD